MASSADIAVSSSNYVGNEALGGGAFVPSKIDTKPIEQLAAYTLLYNKAEYERKQKDADEMIAEFSDLAKIHVNDLQGKDRGEMIDKMNKLWEEGNAAAKKTFASPKDKMKFYADWYKKVNDVGNDFSSGKARSIKYQKELETINTNTAWSAETKAEKIKQLDETFNNTKISEQFSIPYTDLVDVKIPDPAKTDIPVVQHAANEDIEYTLKGFNYKANTQAANAIVFGIGKLYPKEGTPEFDKLSDAEKKQAKQQATVDSEAKMWSDATTILNKILQSTDPTSGQPLYFKDLNGFKVFDAKKFEDDNGNNKLVMGAYNALKAMDADARKKAKEVNEGKFSDRGFNFSLPLTVSADDFKDGFVDFTKPITPTQVVTAGIFSKYGGDEVKKKVTQTNIGVDYSRIAMEKYKAWLPYSQAGSSAAPENVNMIYGINSDVVKSTQGGEFKGYKMKGGAVVDADGNIVTSLTDYIEVPASAVPDEIVTEYNKYAGTTKMDKAGNILQTPSTTKLIAGNKGTFRVHVTNGVIDGIKTTNSDNKSPEQNTYASAEQFKEITDRVIQKDVTKYRRPTTAYSGKENPIKEVEGNVDVSTLADGSYKIKSGKYKGKTVTVQNGSAISVK